MTTRKDLTGMRFGLLTVLRPTKAGFWLCRCDCGKEKEVKRRYLISGHTRSCGCMRGSRAPHMAYKGCNEDCFNCPYPDCYAPYEVTKKGHYHDYCK